MANPATTHVIELETGIGEPAFIPLCLGQELQPLSVGKKGMWKLESPRMLDVHAFFYFDGNELFAQSADETIAALVDGKKIGKAWTQLNAPCNIDVAGTRLRYRSLADNAGDDKPTSMLQRPPMAPPARPSGQEATGATMALPPRHATQPPAGPRPARSVPPPTNQGPLPARSAPPPAIAGEPSFGSSKGERPFRAGEFSAPAGEESTRVAPLDGTGVSRRGTVPPRPAAGRPVEFDTSQARPPTRPPAGSVPPGVFAPTPPPPPMMPSQPVAFAPMPMQGMQGMQPTPPPGAYGGHYPPLAYPAPPPHAAPPPMQPPVSPSGTFGSSLPGGFGPTPSGTQPAPAAEPSLGAKWAALSIPKKILIVLAPFSITSAIYLFVDEPAPPRHKTPTSEASAHASSSAAPIPTAVVAPGSNVAVQPGAQAWPPGVPCPPPGWPANTPLPCIPNGVTTAATPIASPVAAPVSPPQATPAAPQAAKEATKDGAAPAVKTLERQAVEALAANDYAKAATLYGELARRDPQSAVYAEAARIARSKLDGGAP